MFTFLQYIIKLFRVVSKNAASNNWIADVIGNKTDNEAGTSLYSKSYIQEKHIHSENKVFPTLANDVAVISGSTAWALGALTTLVPANTIALPFDIHWLNVSTVSASDDYELHIFADGVLVGAKRFTRISSPYNSFAEPIMTPIIAPNAVIAVKLAAKSGNKTANISIEYHTY